MTLLAFAADRRAAVHVDRYRLPAGPTAANPPHAAAASDGRDRIVTQTAPATYYAECQSCRVVK